MGVFAFHGGHGTAAAAAATFDKLGVPGNMSVGMVLSTLGLVVAMAVGMIMVNYGIRKGWGTYVKEPQKQPDYFYGGVLPKEKRAASGHTVTTSISINHLALQVSWLLLALFIGRQLFGFLGSFSEFFAGMPSVLHGIFGGAILVYLKAYKVRQVRGLKDDQDGRRILPGDHGVHRNGNPGSGVYLHLHCTCFNLHCNFKYFNNSDYFRSCPPLLQRRVV